MKNGYAFLALLLMCCTALAACGSRADRLGAKYPESALKGWEGLDATTTGLKGDYAKLTPFDDTDASVVTYQYDTYYIQAGQTISDNIILHRLDLSAGGITIERCLIQPISMPQGMWVVGGGTDGAANIVRDCEIDGSKLPVPPADDTYPLAYSGTGIIEGCYIHDTGAGIWIENNDAQISVAQGNYVCRLKYINDDHMAAMTTRQSSGVGLILRNNRLVCDGADPHCTGALFIQPFHGYINNVLIKGNLLEGYGYNLSLDSRGHGYGYALMAINNRFNPAGYGAVTYAGHGFSVWRDNYLDDPLAADHKGTPVEVK